MENGAKKLILRVSSRRIDFKRVEDLKDIDAYGMFSVNDTDTKKRNERAAIDIYRHLFYSMVGYIGDVLALKTMASDIRQEFLANDERPCDTNGVCARDGFGPFNHRDIWTVPNIFDYRATTTINITDAVFKTLHSDTKLTKAQMLGLVTTLRDNVTLAFVMQQSLNALANGHGVLKILFSAFEAAQYVERGLITRQDILSGYCTCSSIAMRATTEHYCMVCHTIRLCESLVSQATSDCQILVCIACSYLHPELAHRAPDRTVDEVISASLARAYTTDMAAMGGMVA